MMVSCLGLFLTFSLALLGFYREDLQFFIIRGKTVKHKKETVSWGDVSNLASLLHVKG